MNERERLRAAIVEAVGAVRRGSEDDALVRLNRLGAASNDAARASVSELARANVDMVRGLAGEPADADVMIVLDGADVDEFEPAQRAATRVLLAVANGRPQDADTQLDIVEQAGDRTELGQVFLHTLCWTLDLMDSCEASGGSVPPWLRPAVSGG
jgi:hypothetical protein